MKATKVTGIGEPDVIGKRNLFQPPKVKEGSNGSGEKSEILTGRTELMNRIRTTISLTHMAMSTIQEIQNDHRLRTGKVLPLWKVVSDAIEEYGRKRKDGSEDHGYSDRGPGVQKTSRASLAQT